MSVIVDDRDPLVEYSPQGGWGHPSPGSQAAIQYQGTTTRSIVQGDTATFKFSATGVAVFGTLAPSKLGLKDVPSMTFSIDGQEGTAYVAPVVTQTDPSLFHQTLWTSGVLAEGLHTLTMTVGPNVPSIINLDYLMYNTSSTAEKTLFIDDSDPRVEYLDWQEVDPARTRRNLQHTGHEAQSSQSLISFSFEGTFASLNGIILPGTQPEDFNASVVIDGGEPFTLPPFNPTSEPIFNYELFRKTDLEPGDHSMTVSVFSGQQAFALDYFSTGAAPTTPRANSASNLSAVADPSAASSASLASSSITMVTPTSGNNLGHGPSVTASSSERVPLAALIGCILGGVAVLLLLIFAGVFIWRRRGRKLEDKQVHRASIASRWSGRRESVATLVTLQDVEAQPGTEYRKSHLTPRYLSY
ncbi:hypothetical protein C8R43DRAFT_1102585 [Mycena crocata]|nr:hypothetical protein C8R43DRAFT_1102585 [Mycena crocata]